MVLPQNAQLMPVPEVRRLLNLRSYGLVCGKHDDDIGTEKPALQR